MATFERTFDVIRCLQADPVIEIADSILENGDPRFLSVGDGIVTFHCRNGDVVYGLTEHDDLRETWLGIKSGVDPEELHAPTRGG